MLGDKSILRDEFFNAISASVELQFVSDETRGQLRIETYNIKSDGPSKVQLLLAARLDGTMASVLFCNVACE